MDVRKMFTKSLLMIEEALVTKMTILTSHCATDSILFSQVSSLHYCFICVQSLLFLNKELRQNMIFVCLSDGCTIDTGKITWREYNYSGITQQDWVRYFTKKYRNYIQELTYCDYLNSQLDLLRNKSGLGQLVGYPVCEECLVTLKKSHHHNTA